MVVSVFAIAIALFMTLMSNDLMFANRIIAHSETIDTAKACWRERSAGKKWQ